MTAVTIGGRAVGPGHPPLVVAELSANHDGRLDRALALVAAAHEAGADAIKLQTYTADTLTIDCDAEPFRIRGGTPWDGRTLHELYRSAATPWEWHAELFAEARRRGILAFSTPFDATAVAFLEDLDVPAHKVASFELPDIELLTCVGRTGRPVILSTGMASLDEIERAVQALRAAGAGGIILLKCTSAYPAPVEAANLRTLPHLARTFEVPVGLSDHTLGSTVPVAAVALGACLVEKHLKLSAADAGPDSAFSMEPVEFAAMVQAVRAAAAATGEVHYGTGVAESTSVVFRRSIFAVRDVAAGEPFTRDNVRVIRPGMGLAPHHLPRILGRRASRAVPRSTPLSWSLVSDPVEP